MRLSQKCYYALRAVFELAKRPAAEPVSIAAIAQAQDVPVQFLQVIMRELRQGGFVESRRGKEGGYLLARPPSAIPVGEVLRFLEGDLSPVDCVAAQGKPCERSAFCAFQGLWCEAQDALARVFDGTTFADLVERERAHHAKMAPDFVI